MFHLYHAVVIAVLLLLVQPALAKEPLRVIGWRAWYAGDAVYDSRTTTWEKLPDDGVVIIVLYMNQTTSGVRYKRQMMANDWYFRAPAGDDFIYGHNNDPPEENIKRFPGAILKRGQWVTDAEMEADSWEAVGSTWEE